jgi:4-amino-4-deoxy-L-arabinose transferase-like glycosyltransferase
VHRLLDSREQKDLLLILLLALAVTVPSLFFRTIPTQDTALYSSLTYEFSQGNFERAFHPGLPPILTTLGGTVNLLLGDPFLSNRIISILLFLPGVIGTYVLARELRGPQIAHIAALMYAICPYAVGLATSGGVDSGKLGLLPWFVWVCYGWCKQGGCTWAACAGAMGGLLSLARGEGFFFALTGLAVFLFSRFVRRDGSTTSSLSSLASLFVAAAVLLLVTLPWVLYEKERTGLAVTHPTQFMIYGWLGIKDQLKRESIVDRNSSPRIMNKESKTEKEPSDDRYLYRGIKWGKNVEETIKGFYYPFLALALVGVFGISFRESVSKKDLFPLIFVILNLAIFFPTTIALERYFSATIPLYLHFSAMGVAAIGVFLTRFWAFPERRIHYLGFATLIIFALLSQRDLDYFMDKGKRQDQLALMRTGNWIKEHRSTLPSYGNLPSLSNYHNGRLPVILEMDTRLRFYALADSITLYEYYSYTPEQIIRICREGKVSLVLYNKQMEEVCPGFGRFCVNSPHFKPLYEEDYPGNGTLKLLAFCPEIYNPD